MEESSAAGGENGGGKGGKGGGRKNSNKSLDEKFEAVQERSAKLNGTPEAAEKMPKLEAREKRLRAQMAGCTK